MLLRRHLTPLLAAHQLKRPVLWMSLPTALPAIGQFSERAVVYYCGDDFGALEGVDHVPVTRLEAAVAKRADLIIAASETLASRFPADKTISVPHGADVDLFSTAVPRALDLPNGKPIAGYYGSVAGWLDLEAIAGAARHLPDWNFVLIGPIKTDTAVFAGLPNVFLMGARDHGCLPAYSQHWTVSLLPFRDTPQIRACNPLKLREYLAAGRPIAATIPFPALAPYRDHIAVAATPTAFAEAILAARDDTDHERRRNAVAGESWLARAALVHDALERL